MDGAAVAGGLRVLGVLAVVLIAVGGWRFVRRRRRRPSAAPAEPGNDEAVEAEEVLQADGAERVGGPADGDGEVGV